MKVNRRLIINDYVNLKGHVKVQIRIIGQIEAQGKCKRKIVLQSIGQMVAHSRVYFF